MVRGMFLLRLALVFACSAAALPGATGDRVAIPTMKTSIYVGSVTLVTTPFERNGDEFTATYAAKVRPWFFWGETGEIRIKVPATDLLRLLAGETVEFTGDAANHKKKPRNVTGRAQPSGVGSKTGKIKVRIGVDDTELIFNGTYELTDAAKD